jgi:hypothetical protein
MFEGTTMNNSPTASDSAITLPYRPILVLFLALSALSLLGAGASIATAQPPATEISAG